MRQSESRRTSSALANRSDARNMSARSKAGAEGAEGIIRRKAEARRARIRLAILMRRRSHLRTMETKPRLTLRRRLKPRPRPSRIS